MSLVLPSCRQRALLRHPLAHERLAVGRHGPGYHTVLVAAPRLNGDIDEFGVAELPPGARGRQLTAPGPTSPTHVVGEGLAAVVGGREVRGVLPAVPVHPAGRVVVDDPVPGPLPRGGRQLDALLGRGVLAR